MRTKLLVSAAGLTAVALAKYEEAAAGLDEAGAQRALGLVLGNLGLAIYRTALAMFDELGDTRIQALARGGLGALLVATDRIDEATSAFLEASRTAKATGDPLNAGAVEIYRAHLDRALGAAAEADRRVEAAKPLAAESQQIRLALNLLHAAHAKHDDAGGASAADSSRDTAALRIGAGGAWFVVAGGLHVDLSRRPALCSLLLALAQAHRARPGAAVGAAELLACGWPGESVSAHAGGLRVRVTLATLRKRGLREFLVGGRAGWMLDPAAAIVLEGEGRGVASR